MFCRVLCQIWGVGVVLWEMLAAAPGQVPYDWIDDWDELTELVQRGDARVDLRLRLPTDPQWSTLTALARACLDPNPDLRPTAAQACARLRGHDGVPSVPPVRMRRALMTRLPRAISPLYTPMI